MEKAELSPRPHGSQAQSKSTLGKQERTLVWLEQKAQLDKAEKGHDGHSKDPEGNTAITSLYSAGQTVIVSRDK